MHNNHPEKDEDIILVGLAQSELPYVTVAYEKLVRRHYTAMYKIALNILSNASEAEDVCQHALLKIFNGLPQFEQRASFKTWAFRIATNCSLTRLKTLKKEKERYSDIDDLSSEVAVDDKSLKSLFQEDFQSIISSLNSDEQQIISLRYISDLTLAEIADAMEISLSATKMRFYRAIEKLKDATIPQP